MNMKFIKEWSGSIGAWIKKYPYRTAALVSTSLLLLTWWNFL